MVDAPLAISFRRHAIESQRFVIKLWQEEDIIVTHFDQVCVMDCDNIGFG